MNHRATNTQDRIAHSLGWSGAKELLYASSAVCDHVYIASVRNHGFALWVDTQDDEAHLVMTSRSRRPLLEEAADLCRTGVLARSKKAIARD